MCDEDITRKTKETAKTLFGEGIKMDSPYRTWREFDKDLAKDFSRFNQSGLGGYPSTHRHVDCVSSLSNSIEEAMKKPPKNSAAPATKPRTSRN